MFNQPKNERINAWNSMNFFPFNVFNVNAKWTKQNKHHLGFYFVAAVASTVVVL